MINERNYSPVTIENAKIVFRNFRGEEGRYNREGDRNFCVLLDLVTANRMKEDGWNVKILEPREEGEEPIGRLQVAVSYAVKPPKIVLVSSRGRTPLDETNISILDYADIAKVDMIINPSYWESRGNSGIKAYLKTMYVTINEDELDIKYSADSENVF